MGTTREPVIFSGFGLGEYGVGAPWMVGFGLYRQKLLYKGAWTGQNCVRSIDQSIMPRSGLVDVGVTGVPVGKVLGFTWIGVPGKTGVVVIGNTVYRCDVEVSGSALTSIGTLAVTPTSRVSFAYDGGYLLYATVYNDKCYKIDVTAGTTTALTGSPGGQCITIHGDSSREYLIVGNTSGHAQRIWWSTGGDFTNWNVPPAVGADANFPAGWADIGDTWSVVTVASQRTHLAIAKQESWWVLTGPMGGFTLRPIIRHTSRWPMADTCVGEDGDNNLWFFPFADDIPAVFDGAKMGESRALRVSGGVLNQAVAGTGGTNLPIQTNVVRNLRHDEVLFTSLPTQNSTLYGLLRQEGLWQAQQFNVPSGFNQALAAPGSGGRIHFCDGGDTARAAKFYTWSSHLDNRPPLASNGLESNQENGANVVSTFTLPEWWARQGEVVSVRAVLVDLKRWNTGYAAHNHFDCNVTNLRPYVDIAATPYQQPTTFTQSFDEATSAVPGGVGGSQLLRLQLNYAMEFGNGFQIQFANLQGVSIQKVVAWIDVDQKPRAI